jgi:predicted TIM-barrel fold metal-dependent hydrolase
MLIVDAQIHLWTGGVAPPHHWRAPFAMEDALREMDAAGVDRAINCPAIWDPAANKYAIAAARAHPDRFATLGWFDTARPAEADFVDRFVAQPGMLGLRFVLVSPAQQALLRAGALEWIWAAADRLALPVGLIVPGECNGELARIAGQYPRLRLLIDHIGIRPFLKLPEAAGELDAILDLARFPNVAVKATGTPSMAVDEYPFASIHPVLKRTFDAFGPRRMFWGTDYTRMTCSWHQCVRQFTAELDWLGGEDLEWVMGRGVCAWTGWPVRTGTATA